MTHKITANYSVKVDRRKSVSQDAGQRRRTTDREVLIAALKEMDSLMVFQRQAT